MRVYTVHLRDGRPPLLVREGFSWGAAIFGFLWLFWHRAWLPGLLALVADIALDPFGGAWAGLVLAWALGVFGNDLRRWSLARRGYALAEVVAAADEDSAFARLIDARPDLRAAAVA